MTDEQALEKILIHLTETRGSWRSLCSALRRVATDEWYVFCPITSLVGQFGTVEYIQAARSIGMGAVVALKIAQAADADPCGYDPVLRSQMLAAAGVEDPK
jgi:hypothetical protein